MSSASRIRGRGGEGYTFFFFFFWMYFLSSPVISTNWDSNFQSVGKVNDVKKY